ncbi:MULTISPECIES: energy transducer TonB [unclassified Pseudomonas]|uniref:energy transducer TonB n=1 Tax=unclassified Pseudomonas TaxID=196821 RepID=UPI00194434A5|nr:MULTISPECIES: energy transducer TonB [unclassified Pseudomonas]MDC0690083.1 energy transducer TonB [Mitsuaria sp. RG]MCE0915900.1 energy transducer TonB [Pseudomonas sp. NMI760_13]MCF1488838.1 energy transducer TonB [Pseudomonas sp. AA27]MCP8633111.1 energy transducer TonB [Pseudomonas sp. DVZ6]MDD7785954.1 energy transducer TonB [Pseudomonas sp. DVZ24]
MTLPADIPADLLPPRVRPVDRLGFTLFLAALVHLALILGVGFTVVKPADIRHTMDITLATFKSEKAPEKADFQAQDNQQGSGTLDKKAVPKTTEVAPFQDSKINKITPPPAAKPETPPAPAKSVVATQAPKTQKVEPKPKESKPQPKPEAKVPDFDSSQLSSQIASLEAELSHEQQLYAKRPRIHRLNAASTLRDKGAWYKEEWRKKVERIGNLNYPEEARRQQMYGSLRMMVSINRDGSLYEVLVLESSGQPVLDQAAQRIVRLAAPFAPFTGDLAEFDRLEIIRTWRFARGDKLSSN